MLQPTYFACKVTDINLDFLESEGIKGIILDVDDTLVARKVSSPDLSVKNWIENLKENGIKVILLSNNMKKRVKSFAEKIGVPFISFGMKPLTNGLKRAINEISCEKSNVLVIGDQIFTDILVSNIFKVRSLLVEPITENKTLLFKIKRFFEKFVKEKIAPEKNVNFREYSEVSKK